MDLSQSDRPEKAFLAEIRLAGAMRRAGRAQLDYRHAVEESIEAWRQLAEMDVGLKAEAREVTDQDREDWRRTLDLALGFIDRSHDAIDLESLRITWPDLAERFEGTRAEGLKNCREIAALLAFLLEDPDFIDEKLGIDFSLDVPDVGPGPSVPLAH